jgi:hypothetical protein
MLLEHGDVVESGEPTRVGNRYLEINFSQEARETTDAEADTAEDRYGDGRAEIVEAWFEHGDGRRATSLETGQRCAFCARVRFAEAVEDPLFGLNLLDNQDQHVLSASNALLPPSGRFAAGEEVVVRIAFDNVFAAGRYTASPAVAQSGSGLKWLDRRERFASVVVTSTRETDAVVDIDYDVEIDRARAEVAS